MSGVFSTVRPTSYFTEGWRKEWLNLRPRTKLQVPLQVKLLQKKRKLRIISLQMIKHSRLHKDKRDKRQDDEFRIEIIKVRLETSTLLLL